MIEVGSRIACEPRGKEVEDVLNGQTIQLIEVRRAAHRRIPCNSAGGTCPLKYSKAISGDRNRASASSATRANQNRAQAGRATAGSHPSASTRQLRGRGARARRLTTRTSRLWADIRRACTAIRPAPHAGKLGSVRASAIGAAARTWGAASLSPATCHMDGE